MKTIVPWGLEVLRGLHGAQLNEKTCDIHEDLTGNYFPIHNSIERRKTANDWFPRGRNTHKLAGVDTFCHLCVSERSNQ